VYETIIAVQIQGLTPIHHEHEQRVLQPQPDLNQILIDLQAPQHDLQRDLDQCQVQIGAVQEVDLQAVRQEEEKTSITI
jgi:hypothetical protein